MSEDWSGKGATLTDGTACREFGLSREELFNAIRSRELQFREASIHGNPCLRLLRCEVEALVGRIRGADYLLSQQTRRKLAEIESELRRLKKLMAELEVRKAALVGRAGAGTR
jgi:hypothetical protein